MQAINKEMNKFNEREVIKVLEGKYEVSINKHFKISDIQKLLIDYQEYIEQMRQKDISVDNMQSIAFLLPALLIKYFTDINIPDEIDKMILVVEKLIDLGVFEEIINEMPGKEIEKINNILKNIENNGSKIGELIGELIIKGE